MSSSNGGSAARNYVIVTAAYFLFTLTDGAIRMLVLLHFYKLGYTPFTLATLFLAQATNTVLSPTQLLTLLAVAMLTSKGASGVTGAGFITLAMTLGAVGSIPVAAMALILGVDRFMSECRALTNVIGNCVATLVVARWEGALDRVALRRELGGARAAHG